MLTAPRQIDRFSPDLPQIGPPEFLLAGFLRAIELDIDFKSGALAARARTPPEACRRESLAELGIHRNSHRVGVDQEVADLLLIERPLQQAEELGMDGGLTAGELQDIDEALARDHARDAANELVERGALDLLIDAEG